MPKNLFITFDRVNNCVITLGFPNVILLLNILIALIDQWISISKPKFHREKFTSRLVLASSLAVNFFVILLLNFVYVFGVAEIHCAYNEHHMLTVAIVWVLLLFSCIVLAVLIYDKTRPSAAKRTTKSIIASLNNSLAAAGVDHRQEMGTKLMEAIAEALDLMEKKKSARRYVISLIPILILPFL